MGQVNEPMGNETINVSLPETGNAGGQKGCESIVRRVERCVAGLGERQWWDKSDAVRNVVTARSKAADWSGQSSAGATRLEDEESQTIVTQWPWLCASFQLQIPVQQ